MPFICKCQKLYNDKTFKFELYFDFLLTSIPKFIVQTILCLAAMLGVATRQASSKLPEELKKISTRDLKIYVKKTILQQQFLLMFHLQLR